MNDVYNIYVYVPFICVYLASSTLINEGVVVYDESSDPTERLKYATLGMDGDMPQVNLSLKYFPDWIAKHEYNVNLIKYPARCSMTVSPNDVGHGHRVLKQTIKSDHFRYSETYIVPDGTNWQALMDELEATLDRASYDTIGRLVAQAPIIIKKAFTDSTVISSWETCGLLPLNTRTILARNKFFLELNQEDADYMHNDCLPLLTECMKMNGHIPESYFEEVLSAKDGLDNCRPKLSGLPLDEMHTSRQRAVVMNSDGYQQHINALIARKSSKPNPYLLSSSSNKKSSTVQRLCSNCSMVKNDKSSVVWINCCVKYCRKWSCDKNDCLESLRKHEITHLSDTNNLANNQDSK